jgi:putative solute:sodium symporter small subunit
MLRESPMQTNERLQAYWKENLTYITILLGIWFAVSYLCGIMIADGLDAIQIGGFKLGFWFANQGSEVIFVVLIYVYVQLMNKLDRKYDVHED